jgi:16S rRNA (guanine527-N7)-methyltransferase
VLGTSVDVFERFRQEAEAFGVSLDDGQIEQFRQYLDALREWNRVVGLVSRDDTESIVWRHFMDSLSPLPFVEGTAKLLDIGSGGGFPGVPLKIVLPEIELHLVESQRRKAHFLKHLMRQLQLREAAVHHCRIDQKANLGAFSTIISRAVAAPRIWLSWALDLLERGGQIIVMVGPCVDMNRMADVFKTLGLRPDRAMDLVLPVIKHRRRIVSLRRAECFT